MTTVAKQYCGRNMVTHLEVAVPAEHGHLAGAVWVGHSGHRSIAVLIGHRIVTRDVIEVILKVEVQQQVIGARRLNCG